LVEFHIHGMSDGMQGAPVITVVFISFSKGEAKKGQRGGPSARQDENVQLLREGEVLFGDLQVRAFFRGAAMPTEFAEDKAMQVLSAGQMRTWGELFVCPWRFGPSSDFRDLQDADVQFLRAWPLQKRRSVQPCPRRCGLATFFQSAEDTRARKRPHRCSRNARCMHASESGPCRRGRSQPQVGPRVVEERTTSSSRASGISGWRTA